MFLCCFRWSLRAAICRLGQQRRGGKHSQAARGRSAIPFWWVLTHATCCDLFVWKFLLNFHYFFISSLQACCCSWLQNGPSGRSCSNLDVKTQAIFFLKNNLSKPFCIQPEMMRLHSLCLYCNEPRLTGSGSLLSCFRWLWCSTKGPLRIASRRAWLKHSYHTTPSSSRFSSLGPNTLSLSGRRWKTLRLQVIKKRYIWILFWKNIIFNWFE